MPVFAQVPASFARCTPSVQHPWQSFVACCNNYTHLPKLDRSRDGKVSLDKQATDVVKQNIDCSLALPMTHRKDIPPCQTAHTSTAYVGNCPRPPHIRISTPAPLVRCQPAPCRPCSNACSATCRRGVWVWPPLRR